MVQIKRRIARGRAHITARVSSQRVMSSAVHANVAGHGGCAAVEDGRGGEASFGGLGPVPVGLGAAIPTFFAQGLLVQRDEVTVQAEEVAGVVGGLGLVDVCDDKVIEARPDARR